MKVAIALYGIGLRRTLISERKVSNNCQSRTNSSCDILMPSVGHQIIEEEILADRRIDVNSSDMKI